jgi:hypothetical protein
MAHGLIEVDSHPPRLLQLPSPVNFHDFLTWGTGGRSCRFIEFSESENAFIPSGCVYSLQNPSNPHSFRVLMVTTLSIYRLFTESLTYEDFT